MIIEKNENDWNKIHLNVKIDSVEFKKNGYIVYYDKEKKFWDFYRYKDIRSITSVLTYDHNLSRNNDFVFDDQLRLTKKYFNEAATKSCYFTIWNDGNYGVPKKIVIERKFWMPLLKIEKIENPSIFEKIRSDIFFHKYGFYKFVNGSFKWSLIPIEELKEMFKEKENEFQKYVEELKEINQKFIEHLNK